MANIIGIAGDPGTGKTTSMRNLDPKETFLMQAIEKMLPIPGAKDYIDIREDSKKGNKIVELDPTKASSHCKKIADNYPNIRNIVIDDINFMMSNMLMERANETGYNKFSDIGRTFWQMFSGLQSLRSDLKIFILFHTEDDDNGQKKIKTVGKMLDNHWPLDGLMMPLLFSKVAGGSTFGGGSNEVEYKFITSHDGKHPAKAPMGMFDEQYIDNDLAYVAERIDAYQGS